MIQLKTRDGRMVRTVLPTHKHDKRSDPQRRNGTTTGGNNGAAVLEQPEIPKLKVSVWQPEAGGEVAACLNILTTMLASKTRRSALDGSLTALKNLRLELEEYVRAHKFKKKGDKKKLAQRVAGLRDLAASLARCDTGGCLLVTAAEVLDISREIDGLITTLRRETVVIPEEKEIDDEVEAIRERRKRIANRRGKLQFIRSRRRARRMRRDVRLRKEEPDRVRQTLARIAVGLNGSLYTGEDNTEAREAADWRKFARRLESEQRKPWAEYRKGRNGQQVEGDEVEDGTVVVELVVVGVVQTACGNPCDGCPVARQCPNATGGQEVTSGNTDGQANTGGSNVSGDGTDDTDDLFRPDGKWREDGVGD